jgi:CRISPR-associated protein Csb2
MLRNPPPWHRSDAESWINAFVRGKPDDNTEPLARLSYVPLPSIGHAHTDAMIRNVMLVAPTGAERDLEYVASRLDGEMLQPEPESKCVWEQQCKVPHPADIRLERFNPPRGKFIDTHYLGSSSVWQTVTPVILDGHNDKKDAKTIRLIQLALQRAGIETPCDFTWQAMPFFKNCLSAHKYDRDRRFIGYHRPQHLKDRTAVHVKIWFHDGTEQKRPIDVPGPITLGAGRHCGFGLLARTT